ncbi:MAG TPA: formate dehydrogenase accessory sulfurtransferase FdhD [Rhodoferax sp.]|nr:formate dehydrogenase accessory sulfurtransferase FdhD [Rhodoferax sp.]HOS86087.1 formate dehydrogenase accessory sulfurtransferase FdhD [Burkholderiaceae bacterium]HPL79529.1 formate dehydrogenase accessory sulfurtransferase FdhD [Burkholderiaceae bacterium]
MNAITSPERATLVQVSVEKWRNDQRRLCLNTLAEEVPIALEYNGISHAVMLASPFNLEDFALGFSLSEGILADSSELFDCEVSATKNGIQVQMQIASGRFAELKSKRRNLTGRTGCGLCGAETLEQAIRRPPVVNSTALFSAEALYAGMDAMQMHQHLQHQTGATHAAAWLGSDGRLELVREDVGRHNALDKLIGAMASEKRSFSAGAALITSRASYEMVQKAATLGIGFLAAISAPTSLAVQLAKEAHVTLLGFVRHQSHVVYTQPLRLECGKLESRSVS